jgi:hypothetical protein
MKPFSFDQPAIIQWSNIQPMNIHSTDHGQATMDLINLLYSSKFPVMSIKPSSAAQPIFLIMKWLSDQVYKLGICEPLINVISLVD